MNCLTWPTDCKENIQWVGQGERPWQLRALHIEHTKKEIDPFKMAFISCQICQSNTQKFQVY